MSNETKKYPSCFPKNFETEILPKDVVFKNIRVYRIIKNGSINRDSFLSSYEEDIKSHIVRKLELDPNNPSTYSTSCFEEEKKARKVLKFFMKRNPVAFIAKGITDVLCGPNQETFIRTSNKKDKGHVDWWIYEDANPQNLFEKVED